MPANIASKRRMTEMGILIIKIPVTIIAVIPASIHRDSLKFKVISHHLKYKIFDTLLYPFSVKTTRIHTQGYDPKVYYHYFINFTISIAIDKAIIFKKVPARFPC